MVEIIWTDNAIQDLNEIGDYISLDSTKYAERTVSTLFDAPSILFNHPRAGKVVPEFASQAIRELILGNYRIIYRIVNYTRIDILTVHNCSRLIRNVISFIDEDIS
ncbi:MAG: type II toxin-antitoxin system RelE/ParE family toxin [Bacteroidota bacterium]|nr:type II toxin-antitoxin system RelE/ParE family toxin [Odoribacter sp.]MDP3641618.1 type II toxin-antitoxin system RelE/ParE family toxin [Bacteroidota bacterium]